MDIKQTLLDFHNTLKSSPEISDDELLNKFPQIGKDNLSAAFDYSATLDSGKYQAEDDFLDKFPEFFPVKKKEVAVDGGTLPEVVVTASKQSTTTSSPASTSASVSAPSPLPLGVEPVVTEEMKERYKRIGGSTGSLNSIIEQKKKSDPTFAPKASEFIRSAYDLNQQGKGAERTSLLYDFFSKNSDLQTNKNTRESFISSGYAGVYNSQSPELTKEYESSDLKGVLTGRQFNGLKSLSFGKQSEYNTAIQKLNDPNTSDVEKEAVKLELDVIGADIDQDAAATMINQNKNLPIAVDLFNKAKDEKIAAQERLRQIDYENPYTARAFGNIVTNAIDRGTKVGETADILNVTAKNSGINIERLAELQKLQQDAKATKLYEEFSDDPSFELFKKNPLGILLELSLESMSALYSHGASRMAAGAGTGAALGSVVPGIGTAAGAGSGVLAGLGMASLNLEYSGKIIEGLSQLGVDVTDANSLKSAFADEKIMDKLKSDGLKKGIPVALFDMLSGGIAGKIAARAGKGIIKKTLANTGEVLVQAGLGGAGEAAGQLVSEGKISSPNAIVMEMIGETGPGSVEIVYGTAVETAKRNKEISTKDAVTIIAKGNPAQVNNTIDANIASGNLTQEQGAKLKTKISQTQADIKKVPEDLSDAAKAEAIDLIKKKDALVEQSKNLDPAFKPEAEKQIKDLESQILGVVDKDRNVKATDLPEVTVTGIKNKATDLPEVTVTAGKKLFNEPNPETKVIATEYKQAKGIDTPEGAPITKVDENKSKSIADAYDAMENNPNDPEVKASYEAMAKETKEQYDAITKSGVKFEIFEGEGEPYKNSEEMIKDVRDNKHLFVLSTDKDFGQNPITDQQRNDNPLLRDSGAKDINGKPLLMNDVFRGVHDFFGHTERGNSFGAVGEENAWDVHARMFTPLARRAMTTETRGQNSWVNFGKQMRNPDGSIKKKGDEGFMSARERPFAEQKIGLLPEEFSNIEDNYTNKSPKFTVTADAPVDLPNVTVSSPIHKKVIADVNQAAKTLASSGIKFKIYDNADSFASESGQDKSTQGVFVDEDGTVSINLAAVKNSKDWNIAWHESSHPVMNIIRNTDRSLYDSMAKGLADLAKTNTAAKAIVNWSENNYEGKETQVDEAMVESIALMADGTIDFDSVPAGFKQAVIDFVNEIAKYLGLDPLLSDTDKATFIKKAKEISNALKTGTDISEVVGKENIREYQNNLDTPEVVVAGQMKNNPQARISETPAIDVYESKETEKLPVRSIEDVYKKFDGKAVAINSDPTRVGELTLPSGKKIFMYGGPAYLSLKDNVDAGVGFATTQPSKVKTWSTYLKSVFGGKDGVTFVTTQAPTSMMANSYSLRYVLDAISTLPKSILKSKEFKDEFFGKDLVLLKDAFGEKGYNDFVNKYKKADLSDSKVIDGMIAEMAYKVGDDNKPASFKARGAFVGNLLGGIALKADIKGVEGDKGYVSKKPTKFIAKQLFDRLGLNQEKLFYEIGEKSLVDLYMNEGKWGMAVAGFETKAGASIDPAGGVKHPLFNAKFPGSDAFLLDGAYEIDKLFAPQDIISSGGNPYTKSAAQMLAGSMYVMGDKTKGEKSFEYKPSPISGSKIQQKKSAVVLAEMESIVKTAKENGTYLKAPNGKATKLNPDQWAEVRTKNFKNWFGDWEKDPANASKVVDENGEPRVVFHGTNVKFDQFDKSKLGSKNWMADSAYTGFFFAGDEKTSQAYVGINNADWIGLSLSGSPILTSVVEKYKSELEAAEKAIRDVSDAEIDIERKKFEEFVAPIAQKLREEGTFSEDIIKNLLEFKRIDSEVFQRINELNEENGNNGRLNEVKNKIAKEVEKGWLKDKGLEPTILNLFLNVKNPFVFDFKNAEDTEGLTDKIQDAKLNKNDGVIFKNLADGAEVDDIFVTFEPNQIKSATDNTGEFSTASNKIQQKVGKVELPATTQKQMTEDDKGNYLFYHYSDKNIKKIDPNKFGSNTRATGRDERPGVGISMYYTRPDVKEQNVPSEYGYVVRVPKGKVYPFNQDPLNLIEPARRMFEKQYPGQAFDPNKQVAWVSKAAAGRGYPMTVAEWNIGKKKLIRAQTTEALKPEVFSKVKPGTFNQVETNPALAKFKPNAKRGQAKVDGGLSIEDLKDFNNLPNIYMADKYTRVKLTDLGIDLSKDNYNLKSISTELSKVVGPYQPIFKALANMPKSEKVRVYDFAGKENRIAGGTSAGLYTGQWLFGNGQIGVRSVGNEYAILAHEAMHWLTWDSINKQKGTPEYKSLERIFDYVKAKKRDRINRYGYGTTENYGLAEFSEFMAEILVSKNFRDSIADVMAENEKEFKESIYSDDQKDSGDFITTIVNYVSKVLRDYFNTWARGIDFNKSMLDNATDLAVKAYFAGSPAGGPQLSSGSANVDADTRKSVANMIDKLSDDDIAQILMDEKGLTKDEAMDIIEDVKYDPALNPSVKNIVGDLEEDQKARGLSKTFPDRGVDTIAKINDDAKKYFVVSNKQTAEEAQAFIDEKNPEDALDYLLTQPTDIPNRVRIWMSGAVMDKIDTAINAAQLAGDTATAQRLSEKQAQLVNQVAPLGTELGQAIQAFRRFYENSKGSPSMLQFYIKKITDQVENEKGKPLTDEERKNIVDLAKNVQSADEGLPKDEATYALGNYVSTITPVAATDIMEAIWYAHILSGITTQSTNFFANLWNSFAEGAVVGTREAIKTKSVMPFLNGMQGFLSGIKQGANDAADILKTGVTKQDGDKFRQGNILEFFSWKQVVGKKAGGVLDWAGGYSPKLLKYVGRALAATDAAFARANSEAISRVMAYNIAQEEGKTNPDLKINKRVDELLNKTAEKKAEAQEKAKAEGYLEGTTRYRRRVGEIMEAGRSKELRKEADEFGKRVTLNYEPEGFMRPVYKLALAMQQATKLTRMFIPFTRIVVNLTENALNYTPLGFVKTAVGSTTTDTTLKGNVRRKLTPDERADFAIKATIGLSTFVLLSGLTGEDDDDLFEITANGSGNKQKNYELMKSGWRPYSIKTKDGRYISYKDWPIAPVLAAVGAMHDSGKYNSSDEPTNEATIAAQAMVVSLYDKSVMKGLQDFVEIIDPKEEYNQSTKMFDRLKNWGADQARTMAVSNFTQQAFKFSSEAMDNPIKASKGVERIYRDIPYLNDGLNPILDVFGEPVKPSTSERLLPITLGKPSKDQVLAAFNENGVYIGKPKTRPLFLSSDPSNEETRPMTDQEYYQFTKRSGQITKEIIMEEWDEIKKILAITDKKKRRAELKDYMSKLIGDAREEAFYEFPNQE
jgi:hypothetical protein